MGAIADIRAFNRFYTERIGALDEHFLGRDRPLGEARFLFEVGPDGAALGDLRERLGLDSGYTSRLVRSLEHDGLVQLVADPDDGRRRLVALTPLGVTEWEALDRLSDEQVEAIVAPLGPRRSAELAGLLATARRLIAAGTATFRLADARSAPAQSAVAAYFAELDELFPTGFDPGDALTADADAYDPPTGAFVLALADGAVVGCGGMWTLEPGVGEIKRMWVDPAWRGLGLAARLLADLEQRSVAAGHQRTVLDTNGVLHEAIAMYRRAGYREIERYNDNPYAQHFFEKRW